jgi:hypothetical protein
MLPGILSAQDTLSRKEIRKEQTNFLLQDRPWTIEIPLWIPGYAGSFAYGDVEIEGEDGVDPEQPIEPPDGLEGILSRLFSDDWYLKFFFISRLAYENNRFLAQADGLTGSVGESIKFNYNDQEIVQAHFRSTNFRLFGGYKFIDASSKNKKFTYELFGYLGVRMHFNKIYAELNDKRTLVDINPSWVEPILGLQNQFTWKRWFIVVQGDYGGFFVNSKYSSQFSSFIYYKCGKLISVKLGWNHLGLNHKGTFLEQDYRVRATLSGPSTGVAFQF